jgi:hypothetical protein
MSKLEKLKAHAIEWEQLGDAEDRAACEALRWLPHADFVCPRMPTSYADVC